MPVSVERDEGHTLIRLEDECGVTSAVELKTALVEGLASGGELQVDLEGAEEIDVTALQLLWAAGREAERTGVKIAIRASEAAAKAALSAGFEGFPGASPQ